MNHVSNSVIVILMLSLSFYLSSCSGGREVAQKAENKAAEKAGEAVDNAKAKASETADKAAAAVQKEADKLKATH